MHNLYFHQQTLLSRVQSAAFAFLFVFLAIGTSQGVAATSESRYPQESLPAGVSRGPAAEGISEYRFANGFKLLLMPDESQELVTLNMTYLVGSRHENYGETGMAHLLEHLLFKGTPEYPSIPHELGKRGMNFNATTSRDRTNYFETFEANDDNLRWVIQLEGNRMIRSNIAQHDLKSEMTVVRNEFEQGENDVANVMMKRLQSVAYDWHSYGRATIGNRSDIENVKIENLQAFYRTYYQPDNAVLVVAGKFDSSKVLQWVNESIGQLPRPQRALPPFWTVEPTQDGERQFMVRRNGGNPMVVVAYKVPSALHPDSAALHTALSILTNTPNGRLHQALVANGKAAEISEISMQGVAPGLMAVVATVRSESDIESVKKELITATERFAETPPSANEMFRVKQEIASFYETLGNEPEQLAIMLSEAISAGDWRLLFSERDKLKNVSTADVIAVSEKYFRRDNRTVGIYLPDDRPQRAKIPVAPAITEVLADYRPQPPIAAGEVFEPTLEKISQRTTVYLPGKYVTSGLKVALLPKKTRGEKVSVNTRLALGNERELFGKRAISEMTASMLMRGTKRFTREELADEFSRLKMVGDIYHFQTNRENLNAALGLMTDIFRFPRFDPHQFEQLRNETITALEATRNDPEARATEAMKRHFNRYPPGDIRAPWTVDEHIAAVKSVTLDEIRQFHRHFYGASHGQIAIAGDFAPVTALAAINQGFGNWPSLASYARILPSWSEIPAVYREIDTPDMENGIYLARQNIQMRDDATDYPALLMANYLLGGGTIKSRLADRIRQKDGLSYAVSSFLTVEATHDVGIFGIAAIVAPANIEKVHTAVLSELTKIIKEGFTEEELERGMSSLLKERKKTRLHNDGLAETWVELLDAERNYRWEFDMDKRLSSLTLDEVNTAAKTYLDPARLSVFVARDASDVNAK